MTATSSLSRNQNFYIGSHNSDAQTAPLTEIIIRIMSLSEQLSEEITTELRKKGVREIRSTWAITLFRMGDEAWRGVDLAEIWLGVYNITYPIKKMVGLGLLSVAKDESDKRSLSIRRTEKGKEIARIVQNILDDKGPPVASRLSLHFMP